MIDPKTFVPKESTIAEVREAIAQRRLKTLWKRKIRELNGEVVESAGTGLVRATLGLGVVTHVRASDFKETMEEAGVLRTLIREVMLIETARITKESLAQTLTRTLQLQSREQQFEGLQRVLVGGGAMSLEGTDVAKLWTKTAEQCRGRRFKKLPKWVVVWPVMGPLTRMRPLYLGRTKKPVDGEGRLRVVVDASTRSMSMDWKRGVWNGNIPWRWPVRCLIPVPEQLFVPLDVSFGRTAVDEQPVSMMGVPGSGFVGMAFNPSWCGRGEEDLEQVVRWHASALEALLAWDVGEIDWKPTTKSFVLRVLQWREEGKSEKPVSCEVPKENVGDLGVYQKVLGDYVTCEQRGAILNVARLERSIRDVKTKIAWTDRPTGVSLGEELKALIRTGKILGGYVTNKGQQVVIVLPKVRFSNLTTREYKGKTYAAGVYEMEEMWLMVPAALQSDTMLALGRDGERHPHPHVYLDRGGTICWGRTDRGLGIEEDEDYGQVVLRKLFTEGWESFVDTVTVFFSQWHDTDAYRPLVTCSKWVSPLEVGREK